MPKTPKPDAHQPREGQLDIAEALSFAQKLSELNSESTEEYTPPKEGELLTLSELISNEKIREKTSTTRGAVARVVELVASFGGGCEIVELKRAGATEAAIAEACQSGTKDKRTKPRLKLGIDGENRPIVWLTTTGWQSAGHPNRREKPPSSETLRHARIPRMIAGWWAHKTEKYGNSVPELTIRTEPEIIKEFSEEAVSMAWSRIQGPLKDPSGIFGPLTGGVQPDALMIERWQRVKNPAEDYAAVWGENPETVDKDDLAETWVALEAEISEKANQPLRHKVKKWNGCIELGLVKAVVWVVDNPKVADNLRNLGVGDKGRAPGQYIVPSVDVNLGGQLFAVPDSCLWWAPRVMNAQPK